jgi:hypothetical protein
MVICKENGCKTRASFGFISGKVTFCLSHKKYEMINVNIKKCLETGCDTQPTYGFIGEKATYCKLHNLYQMIDVNHQKCLFTDCDTRPSYGLPGEKATYCKLHMLYKMIDVNNKRCIFIGCDTQPTYGFIGEKATYCVDHKQDKMKDVVSKLCLFPDCETRPSFGFPREKATHCFVHKSIKMIDVVNPKCISCGLFQVKKITNYLCYYCNPEKTKTRKLKETIVKELLEKQGYEFIHDKQVINEYCNKYRPDFVFNCGNYFVVLECDEEAHKHYDKDCEIVRMNNISMDLSKPTLFIRYNPDLQGIRKNIKHQVLLETLEKHLYKDNIQQLEPVYLFYPEVTSNY